MELVLKTNLEIGQYLFYLESKTKTIYAPCVTCNNERKIKVSASGEDFTIDCPKCTGKATKGDTSRSISIQTYTVEGTRIRSFKYGGDSYGRNIAWRISHDRSSDINLETLRNDYNNQYYIDKVAAQSAAKELNKLEKAKGDEFLKGLVTDNA